MTATTSTSKTKPQELVAAIDTGYAAQVRIHLSSWRGKPSLPSSPTVQRCRNARCGAGVTIPIDKLDELITALKAVRR